MADTRVWVNHFRHVNAPLSRLLAQDAVLPHPFVRLELACGTPPAPRERNLADLARLRSARQANITELLVFIEHEKLYGSGALCADSGTRQSR